jgi:transcriptional regulator with XRE-family HTH domain
MTQHALAEAADLSDDMIARIETGATGARFPSIARIAAALEVDPAELFILDPVPGRIVRKPLVDLTARLAALSDSDLAWVAQLLEAALKPRA